MLSHTQEVHADAEPYTDLGSAPSEPARSMPPARPGRVATERAREAEFEVEPASGNGGGMFGRTTSESEDEEESQNPALGTVIALVVIALIILLNILGADPE